MADLLSPLSMQLPLIEEHILKDGLELVIKETEFESSSSDDESLESSQDGVISKAFWDAQKDWIEDPIMSTWSRMDENVDQVLAQVESLHASWSRNELGPFHAASDPLWLSTLAEMRDAGLPLYNNNINMPEDTDEGWPFHFKEAERFAVISKGSRVGDSDPAGYVCNWHEANHYCIRALQQEFRRLHASQKPLLMACKFNTAVLRHIGEILGLELAVWNSNWPEMLHDARLEAQIADSRPIIFAATLSNDDGETDDFDAIESLAGRTSLLLHVDAARNFDYLTTLSPETRTELDLPRLLLSHSKLEQPLVGEKCIYASTIVAGGMTGFTPIPVVALKPRNVGSLVHRRIQYVKAPDITVSGSRDGMSPLLLGLHEQRFDTRALREIYRRCFENRAHVSRLLRAHGIQVQCPSTSLDLIIHSSAKLSDELQARLGLQRVKSDILLATMQPSVQTWHTELLLDSLLNCASTSKLPALPNPVSTALEFPVPHKISTELKEKVSKWHARSREASGYPFHHGAYTAIGPIVGQFLDIIPRAWVESQSEAILNQRRRNFGVSEAELSQFSASFTTGSTMGNCMGIHAAIRNCPHNFIYVSSAAHYSISKALMDNDVLAGRADPPSIPRFSIINIDATGRMDRDDLVRNVSNDRAWCLANNREYGVTLFVTIGTTFTGAVDDILDLQQALHEIGQTVSYIHADGALDFGFSNCGVRLDRPDMLSQHFQAGIPAVQGITLSHHKAYGNMVSGEVVCFDPTQEYLHPLRSILNPRAVFEVWLFQQMYTPEDLKFLHKWTAQNALYLHKSLQSMGIATTLNQGTPIVLVERPASWIVNRFGLRSEDDWVHYIAMQHVNRETIDKFLQALSSVNTHLDEAFHHVEAGMTQLFGEGVHYRKARPQDIRFEEVLQLARDGNTRSSPASSFHFSDVATLKESYIYSGICTGIYNSADELVALILVRNESRGSVCGGPILVKAGILLGEGDVQQVCDRMLAKFAELSGVEFELTTR